MAGSLPKKDFCRQLNGHHESQAHSRKRSRINPLLGLAVYRLWAGQLKSSRGQTDNRAMKWLLCALALIAVSAPVLAERYSVNVRRIESNLYRDTSSKAIIETRYCYEYAYGEDAILQWEGRYGNNWLIFIESETKCDVVAIR